MYKVFLIKYAEIGIKGNNKHVFEDALVNQIRIALRNIDGTFNVRKSQGHIYVEANGEIDYDEVIEALKKVFGIAAICPVMSFENKEWDNITKEVLSYIEKEYGNKEFTFKVIAKRADKKYPLKSPEIASKMGGCLLKNFPNIKVDVHNPDVKIHIEIRDNVYVYTKEIQGPKGMPLGTNGKAMLLLSGGIDSPVAGYMVAKRGVFIDAVYFHAPPYTSERAKEKVKDLAKLMSKYTGPIRLHIINFTDIQLYIYDKCPHNQLTIIMRRYMMRIAENLAKKSKCLGLVTGESIGQVASQTMESLNCTNEVCTLPVYRPLIGFDKQEIIEVANKINTFETSVLPYEDCCTIFVAKHPVTKPEVNKIRESEENLNEKIDELVKVALDTEEVVYIGK